MSSASAGTTPRAFCLAKISSRNASQPASKRPLYFADHSGRHVVGGVSAARSEVCEEGHVGHQGALLANPGDRLVGHVVGEVVPLLRCPGGLDRRGALVEGRVVLVGLTTQEPVEVVETAAGRPQVERAHGTGLPDRHLMALAELGGRVAVQLEYLGHGAVDFGRIELYPGAEVAISGIAPIPTVW